MLKQAWTQDEIDFDGDIYKIKMPTDPVKPYQQNGGPLLYFGGISPGSKEVCAKYCDVFLMWPEPEDSIYATMKDMSHRAAAKHGRNDGFWLAGTHHSKRNRSRSKGLCQRINVKI
ncbi:MAG: LLM class flavin-dependent oxidoreductase [Arcicella sp.]|nr:LLM class flavin-dependent oxidoreductase [Arcicella sp.]